MKIAGINSFSLSDFPGQCAAIIFTQGCNFRCIYCHNASLLSLESQRIIVEEDVYKFLKSRIGKLDGVVISGGEPTIQDGLVKFLIRIKEMNYQIKLDTNGSNPSMLRKLLQMGLLDYIAMDIKAPLGKYKDIVGVPVCLETVGSCIEGGNVCFEADIMKSIKIICESKVTRLFRTTFDNVILSESDIAEIKELIPQNEKFVVQKKQLSDVGL